MNVRWTQRYQRWTWLAAVSVLLFADQLSKSYFSTTLELGEAIKVNEWFNFVHVLNTGAAFSLLADAGGWQRWFFIGVTALVVGVRTAGSLGRRICGGRWRRQPRGSRPDWRRGGLP
ncbi:signal peptidase II [Hydrogenophaga sp.]|jgi:signal peptidase II|uniref:signal peptidase II n=1 Tax=Hydrogenophaga sp. TaxID=1904254 RepID=UPI003D2D7D21